jgi:hypothetical protein
MEMPQGFQKYYKGNVVLPLLKTLYGTKQAPMAFQRKLVEAFTKISFTPSKTDPSLYLLWTFSDGLIIWTSCVDDCLVCGNKEGGAKAKESLKGHFDCDEVGVYWMESGHDSPKELYEIDATHFTAKLYR